MAGQARFAGSYADSSCNVGRYFVRVPRSTRHGNVCAMGMIWACEWPIRASRRPSSSASSLASANLPSRLAIVDVPHRGQADELRMAHLLRQLLHGERGPHGGGVLSLLELRGHPDPQPLEPQLGVAELGADAEDLGRDRQGVVHVVRPVEAPSPGASARWRASAGLRCRAPWPATGR